MNWTGVPKLGHGIWTFCSLDCGHIRVIYGRQVPEQWELTYCRSCGDWRQATAAKVKRV